MNNKCTMTLKSYITSNIYWGLWFMFCFRTVVFRTVGPLSLHQSKILLWSLLVGFVLLGTAATYKTRRNHLSVLVNVALPFEIYTVLSYKDYLSWQTTACLITASILSTAYILIISTEKIPCRQLRHIIIKRRITKCLLGTRTIIACCFLFIVLSVASTTLFGTSLTKSSINAYKDDGNDTWTIANNIEQVCLFSEERWHSLSNKEKTTAMQVIANIECRYLGLPHELTVVTAPLGENAAASYDDRTHIITINIKHFEESDPLDIIDSICHEAYHAYQHRLCDAYDSVDDQYKSLLGFYDVTFYKQEFAHYTNGSGNFYEYYFQHCETKARDYASDSVDEYKHRIQNHLGDSAQLRYDTATQ